jgi:hypothetical protein
MSKCNVRPWVSHVHLHPYLFLLNAQIFLVNYLGYTAPKHSAKGI